MRQRLSPHSVGITAMLVLAALVAGLLTGVQDSKAQDTPPPLPLAVSAPIRFSYQPGGTPGILVSDVGGCTGATCGFEGSLAEGLLALGGRHETRMVTKTITAAQMKTAAPVEVVPASAAGTATLFIRAGLYVPVDFTESDDNNLNLVWGTTNEGDNILVDWNPNSSHTYRGEDDGTQYIDRRAISFYGNDSISGNGSDANVVVVVYTVVALN